MIRFETSLGGFTVELFDKEAPLTVANFLKYVDDQHFDGTVFHRVVPGFRDPGRRPDAELEQKPTRPPVKNEAHNGLENLRGTLSMARTNDIHSATSQFFVNLTDNDFLDHRPGPVRIRRVRPRHRRHGHHRQDRRGRHRPRARLRRLPARGRGHHERASHDG